MKKYQLLPTGWAPREIATLIYLRDGDHVLLIEKLRGHGAGLVNAPGGRLECGESIGECAIREVREEVGVKVKYACLRGILRFHDKINGFDMLGYAYIAKGFSGIPTKTVEADPFWCRVSEVPYERMWEDDKFWLPRLLCGECINAELVFSNNILTDYAVRNIATF